MSATQLPGRYRLTPRAMTGLVGGYLILILLALIYIYPFLISVSGSFKTDADATQNPLSLLPQTWSFAAYERLFTDVPLLQRWVLRDRDLGRAGIRREKRAVLRLQRDAETARVESGRGVGR